MSSEMQDCFFPNLGIVRNMKPTDVFDIPFPERQMDSDTLTEKLEQVWSCLHTLTKPWENFMFSTISSTRNMSQHNSQFTHLFVTNLTFIFMWVQLVKNQLKIWKKLWPLTIDHFGDNEDSIIFFIFSYLQWNMVTTRFTSTCRYTYTVRAFDLIPTLRAWPEYKLSADIHSCKAGTKLPHKLALYLVLPRFLI